jgi:hypothetical protein
MQTIEITAEKLAELLGMDSTLGICDISLDAWSESTCTIKIRVCDRKDLPSMGIAAE